jgi:hypothetical protein
MKNSENIKCYENPFSESQVIPCMQTGRQAL